MESLDFPYFYEDEEDYWTNIDYTNDVTVGKLSKTTQNTRHLAIANIFIRFVKSNIATKYLFSAPPPTIQESILGPDQYYAMLKRNSSKELFLNDFLGPIYESVLPHLHSHEVILLDVVVHIIHALAMTAFILFISLGLIQFPGHKDGSLYPIYIPEHYGKRNSQHPFDPYRLGN